MRRSLRHIRSPRAFLICVVVLAALGGLMRAVFMPPWGLMDEPQHLHYVQALADVGRPPVAGESLLSQPIVDSLFREHRWDLFRWELPASRSADGIGLTGQSYEGYHPPLYYALMAPVHWLWRGSLLGELYAMRLSTLLLSLVSLALVYLAAQEAFPRRRAIAWFAIALLACSPERMHATSRLNNDALLEVFGALTTWLCIVAIQRGLTFGRAAAIGASFGAGVLTKASMLALGPLPCMVLLLRRDDRGSLAKALVMAAVLAAGVAPWIVYNFSTYGDWSGFHGFVAAVGAPVAPEVSVIGLASAVNDCFTRPWVLWQRGMFEMHNALTVGLDAAIVLAVAVAVFGALRELFSKGDRRAPQRRVEFALLVAVASGAAAMCWTFVQGKIPELNGRFLLPFASPAVLLLARGWSLTRLGRSIATPFVLGMFTLAGAMLFASDLQYFYFPREVDGGLATKAQLYFAALFAGRPTFLAPLMALAPLAYVAALVWLFSQTARRRASTG